ncbi:hypothetical protein MTR67_007427 [Solanum verrucosum]|uniref:Uncharacterized protein n=1 Tax=Solanum verrucosum TaxID=315347 RepID=A0AAF0Q071_SOLVR|nr:hypothetical protein MTR67_007427 [Solanum verrucosum]
MLSSSPTKPLSWWEDSDILGGRDEVAGGTWLACTRTGRLAFLTNVREINSNSHTKSRGDLPLRFLKSVKSPHDFSEQLLKEAGEYNGFNLIVADLCSMTMLYITNRPKHTGMSVTEVSPAPHIPCDERIEVSKALKSWEEARVHAKNRDRWRIIPAAIGWSTRKERNSRYTQLKLSL